MPKFRRTINRGLPVQNEWTFLKVISKSYGLAKTLGMHSQKFRFRKMGEAAFNIVNDVSHFRSKGPISQQIMSYALAGGSRDTRISSSQLLQKTLVRGLRQIDSYLKSVSIFSQNNSMMVLWNILLFMIQILQIVILPLKFSFSFDIESSLTFHLIFYELTIILLFIDILVKFNTTYYEVRKRGEALLWECKG